MIEEDKLILLASIMGEDTSSYVEGYLEEIRTSSYYDELIRYVAKARNVSSLVLSDLVYQFEHLDFDNIHTVQDVMILKAQILNLVYEFASYKYINPLLYHERKSKLTLGELTVNFVHQDRSLMDIILDDNFSKTFKIEFFKELTIKYHAEGKALLVDPMIELKEFMKVHHVKLFTLGDHFAFILLILINLLTFSLPFFVSNIFASINALATWYQYMLTSYFALLFISDAYYIFTLSRYLKENHLIRVYEYSLKRSDKITNALNKANERLFKKLIASFDDKDILDKKISSFAISKNYLIIARYFFALKQDKSYRLTYGFSNSLSKILLFFVICLSIVLSILYLILRGSILW